MILKRSSVLIPVLGFLVLFSSAMAQPRTGGRKSENEKRAVAIVNGQSISYDLFEELRQDHINYQRQNGGIAQIDQMTSDAFFMQLVDAEITMQEAAKRKVAVTRNDALKSLIDNPPAFMMEPFMEPNGNFRKDLFTQVVRRPETIVQFVSPNLKRDSVIMQWKKDLEKVIRFVQVRDTRQRLESALVAEKPLTPDAIRNRYFAEKTLVTGSFIRILHSTVPDSLIPITTAEARAWYDTHKEDYRAAPARQIGTLILPIIPLASDSARHRARVDSALRVLTNAPVKDRPALVANLVRTLPAGRFPSGTLVSPRQIPQEIIGTLARAQAGDVIGPIPIEGGESLFYIDGTAPSRDTMLETRHIFMKVSEGNAESDTIAFELLRNLKASLDTTGIEKFEEAARIFGQDGTASRGGMLGYIGHGLTHELFDSAAFNAPIGKIVGPVRTPFGYHLILVTNRLTRGFHLRELRFPLTSSAEARDAAMKDARSYAEALRANRPVDSLLQMLRSRYALIVTDTSYIKRLDMYGDVLTPGEFAFNAQPGDVALLPLPGDRVVVVKLISIWPGGVPEFEKIPHYPAAHARRVRQLDLLRPRVDSLAAVLTPDMLIGPMRDIAPMAEVFVVNSQQVPAPPDEISTILDSLVTVTRAGSVGGPVRGKHGYYFLRVSERSGPTDADYRREKEHFTKSYSERYREMLFDELMKSARSYSVIQDLRPGTQIYRQ